MSINRKPFKANNTDKGEERVYEPYMGVKKDFVRKLEQKDKEEEKI